MAGHRLGKVAGRRADRSEHRHRSAVAIQCRDLGGALVEIGQAARQVGRVAAFARQFAEAARDLAQRLGPARGRIGHQRDVQSLVAEVLGHRDRRVDAGLACGHRHVRRVGDDHRALHQRASGARVRSAAETPRARRPSRCRVRRSRDRRSRRRCSPWPGSRAGSSCRCRSRPVSQPLPPSATGNSESRMRWPVTSGSSDARRARTGRGVAHRPEMAERDLAQRCRCRSAGAAPVTSSVVSPGAAIHSTRPARSGGTRAACVRPFAHDVTRPKTALGGDRAADSDRRFEAELPCSTAVPAGAAGRRRCCRAAPGRRGCRAGRRCRFDLDARPQPGRVLVDLRDDFVLVDPDHFAEQAGGADAYRFAQQEPPSARARSTGPLIHRMRARAPLSALLMRIPRPRWCSSRPSSLRAIGEQAVERRVEHVMAADDAKAGRDAGSSTTLQRVHALFAQRG